MVLYAGMNGYLDKIDTNRVKDFERDLLISLNKDKKLLDLISIEKKISDQTESLMKKTLDKFLSNFS